MTVGLCETRPWEWWDTADDGARLAMALCRGCPNQVLCDDLAQAGPHGRIWAGIPYGDNGQRLPVCYCGYPQLSGRDSIRDGCRRCAGHGTSVYRITIERWSGRSDSDATIGRRLGFAADTIRDARRRWAAHQKASISEGAAA